MSNKQLDKVQEKLNNELIRLIDLIKSKSDLSQEAMAVEMGYNETYLSTVLKRGVSEKFLSKFKLYFSERLDKTQSSDDESFITKRRNLKTNKQDTLMFYEIGANAATVTTGEILPVKKNEGVLHISELFKGSQYAIRISGNSMTPNYPSGAIIGIREINDKQITPGSVYVIEKENDLWIKRLFYKDDNQDSGHYECVSDNTMKFESGTRLGRPYYPSFHIPVDQVRRLFKVTGIYKPNELTLIS